jgi:hypothetical protein
MRTSVFDINSVTTPENSRHAIAGDPRLDHLLEVNQFFVDLVAHARAHPGTQLIR